MYDAGPTCNPAAFKARLSDHRSEMNIISRKDMGFALLPDQTENASL